MKILLEIPIGMSGGYTKDGIGLTRALIERGHTVTLKPVGLQVPLPVDIANLLSVEHYQEPPYDIRIVHQSPLDVHLSEADAAKAKTNIYWTMWEWENYPTELADSLFYNTRFFDYFVAYDSGSFGALERHIAIPEENKFVVRGGYESEDWKPAKSFPMLDRPFVFGILGDISARKNPVALINAFRRFRDQLPEVSSALVIKSRHPFLGTPFGSYADADYGIQEINGVWSRDEMEKFYYSLGAYVAPSWGEGKNLPALEAATCGVPLILSDIPGHRSWASVLSGSVTFVGGEKSALRLEGIPMYGLKIDEDELLSAMIAAYENRHEAHHHARNNVRALVSSMDWYRVVERLGLRLGIPWL